MPCFDMRVKSQRNNSRSPRKLYSLKAERQTLFYSQSWVKGTATVLYALLRKFPNSHYA